MYRSRREFLAGLALAPLSLRALSAASNRLFLIAHRGGIVDEQHPENSPLSVEAAIARGYWMLEVDIRQTKDGEAILQHDPTFERFYGDPRRVSEMTWHEVQQLRATPGGSRPMSFDELCARCAGRIHLMLDIKVSNATDAFCESLLGTLRRHGMLETTYSLNGGRLPALSKGTVPEAANRAALKEAIGRGEPVSTRRFLFELGSDLDAEALGLCREHNVTAVAALNVFRYAKHGDNQLRVVEEDARRLLALGVTHFQIDSVYEPFLVR
jgi:glycerophosphoryl diester phosphodiesterase